ncbi:RHS repeat-associated core domain-containing protein [Pyxidicoccus xibeiensis]|uniref:RHS repeat-associated core domain-containing protein n=1 Tax=Pyxidicoccus xibeiensis TaxID=2906759 RepID=UPI0020A809A4|nr:RHS repeat-associated core domain-containing protein [Pyxidicoccus xibeiensis]MCP3140689.1 RHS repeat-associated core domain-containing protein [Pyxidicoccus xibeiensis]
MAGKWYVNGNAAGSRDRLWQDKADGGWPEKFVYYREGSGRYTYDAVYVHGDGSGARHYFLGRIEDTAYVSPGQVEVPRATLEYAQPSTDGGTAPDPLCPSGAAGSTPGVPYLRTVTDRDGTKLHFYYRRLENTRGRTECVLDHVNVEATADGGTAERTLVQYQYASGGNELARVDHPQTGRSFEYTYPLGNSPNDVMEAREGGALKSRHTYYYSSEDPKRDEAEGHDFAIEDVLSSRPGTKDACSIAMGGSVPTREFADSRASLGTGQTGQTTLTSRFTSAAAFYSHESWRLTSYEQRCDGTSCPGIVPGTETWEYECPGLDSSVAPAMTKAHKDMRGSWESYVHHVPDAGVPEAQGVPVKQLKLLTQVRAGALDSSGTGSLAEVRFGYTYGSTSRSLPAYEQLVERQETASVLAPSGTADPNARTQYVYDSTTNRLKATFHTGWTQVRDSNGAWSVQKRRIGVFHLRAPQCGGTGAEDAQGRVLETHGPCLVDATTTNVASITGCPTTAPFPVTKYEYWSQAETGHRRNRLKKQSMHPSGCGVGASLETQYLEYDAFGNATRVQDANGVITERVYNQDQLARQSIVEGAASTTTLFSYDQGRLKAIQHPQGNHDVFCYRTGTTAGQGCTGGAPTYLLQWRAKAADANGASWSEKVEYSYWPDETVKSATFLKWNGSTAEARRVMTFSADARRRPTFQGLGNLPSPVKASRLFDAEGNLTGIGFPYNGPPDVCGGPDSSGQPGSALCTALAYDRLDRLAKVDEFPADGSSQRTCFTYDAQSNVTSVRQGCAATTGTSDCASCSASTPATEYVHDDFGNLVSVKLPHSSDGAGGAGVTRYVYDALGRMLLKETPEMRARGERVSYEYDMQGRLLRAKRHYTSPQAGQENLYVLSYDVNDPGDATSTPPATCPQPARTAGRLRYRHDSFGRTWYQYDTHGRVAGEIRLREGQTSCSVAGLADRPHTFYTYTANGNLASVIYPHGRVVTYAYGTGANLDRVQAIDVRLWNSSGFADTRLIEGIAWEPFGGLRGYRLNHPASATSSAVEYLLGDNASQAPSACPTAAPSMAGSDLTGRLRALRVSTGSFSPGTSSGDIYKRTYTWAGDQVARLDTCLLGATTPRIETFEYDRTLRLKAAGRPTGNFAATGGAFASRSYGYDGRGNRTGLSEDGFVHDVDLAASPAVDRLSGWGSTAAGSLFRYALSHDADGRVTQKRWAAGMSGTPVYTLGFEYGQTTGVATESVFRSVNVNGVFYNYFYDAMGRRRLKSHPGGTTDEFFHDIASHLLTDRGSNAFTVPVGHYTTDDYVWLGGRPVALVRAKFSSAWVRQPDSTGDCSRDGEPAACGVYFPVTDHIGKPVLMLDGSRRVTAAADHDPFGHVNRVSQVVETAHPYPDATTTTLATFSQPKENSSVVVRLRARYHLVDSEAGVDFIRLVDASSGTTLDQQSGARRGRVTTPWVTPSASNVSVRFSSGPAGGPAYQGAVVDGYEYQRYQSGAQPFWTPLRFPGQYHDAETDLFENWNRYYDPSIGRYLQPEPRISSGPTVLPVYAYAMSNPVWLVDVNGLAPFEYRFNTEFDAAVAGFRYVREKFMLSNYEVAFYIFMSRGKFAYSEPFEIPRPAGKQNKCDGGKVLIATGTQAFCHTHPAECNPAFSPGDKGTSKKVPGLDFYLMNAQGAVFHMLDQTTSPMGTPNWESVLP